MDKQLLTAELLEAAFSCGRSLQKSLALPGMPKLCAALADSLLARTWQPGQYTRFAVQEPKLREIFAPAFADRVVEAWLTALVEEPLSRLLIDDTYANRKGKGTHAAIAKTQKFMRQPGHVWCLQLDVRGFFHSIHRPTLLSGWLAFLGGLDGLNLPPERRDLAAYISTALLERSPAGNHHTVKSSRSLLAQVPPQKSLLGSGPDTGLPIGSAASQHFANFYLNGLDHHIKHTLRVRGYIRYMDDLLLLGPDTQTLLTWRDAVAAYCKDRLRLELHSGKEQITKSGQGIVYLGYKVYPHHLHIHSRSVSALKARLDFFKHLFQPERFPLCQKPMRGVWQSIFKDWIPACAGMTGGLAPPLQPSWSLLKRMEATINSYYGLMGHAQSYSLRKTLYHKHFGPLRSYFLPADAGYSAVSVVKRFLYQ